MRSFTSRASSAGHGHSKHTWGEEESRLLLDLGKDLLVPEEEDVLVVHYLDGHATELGQQHLITHGHTWGDEVTVTGGEAGAHGQHGALVGLAHG